MSVSIPRVYNNAYMGKLSQRSADLILQLRDMEEVAALKNMIFDFSVDLITRSIEEERSIRDIIISDGKELKDYVSELRKYQTIGTAFMYISKKSILGDGVGLGKTVEIAALINYLHCKKEMNRFIMAVENSAVGQTKVELLRFTGLNIVELPTQKAKMQKVLDGTDWMNVDGVVMCHSSLRSDTFSNWLAQSIADDGVHSRLFDVFILDESSVIKSSTTKIYEYTMNIVRLCDRVHFLNATVFETHLMDIYNQVDMLDPYLLPRKSSIENKFCVYSKKTYWKTEYDATTGTKKPVMKYARDMQGYKNQLQFKSLIKLFYFGRCKKDVGLDTPHIYKTYSVEPTTAQKCALASKYRYQEVLNCPSLIPSINIKTDRKSVPKIERVISIIENEFMDDSILIYCFHKEAQAALKNELEIIGKRVDILNGDTDIEDRGDIQLRFNTGQSDVIITSVKKSLNLYGGSVCILYSLETNVAKMEQIRGRIDRNVDDSVKTFILMYYKGTGEEEFIRSVIKQRAKDAKDLILDADTAADAFMKVLE